MYFHFWTSDGEILFLIGSRKYAEFSGDSSFLEENADAFKRCLGFVEDRLNEFGFIPGMDWRDAIPNYMEKCLLASQVLLSQMYVHLGENERANDLKTRINQAFFSPEHGLS